MAEHNDFGVLGENLAKDYLVGKGYQILKERYKYSNAEIDLIAEFDKQIIFVEVKSRKSNLYGNPEVFVNKEKRRNLKKAARAYLEKSTHVGEVRFDIISIVHTNGQLQELKHFEDAFFW